jgi:hypothetical protein
MKENKYQDVWTTGFFSGMLCGAILSIIFFIIAYKLTN